ncbi:MAG: hypothetical protein ACYDHD_06255 [Vulcanimicrobiaceae bacterium]
MSEFRVHHTSDIEGTYSREIGSRIITRGALESFWATTALQKRHGVYVFTIKARGRGAARPFYVGKASRTTFKTETLNDRNRRMFTAALLEGQGRPTFFLLTLEQQRGPINRDAIEELETLMIWIARHRNPTLLNRRKINTAPENLMRISGENRVAGVLNSGSGKISDVARKFRDVMGL